MHKELNKYIHVGPNVYYYENSIVCEKDESIILINDDKEQTLSLEGRFSMESFEPNGDFIIRDVKELKKVNIFSGLTSTLMKFEEITSRQVKFINNSIVIYREEGDDFWILRCFSLQTKTVQWKVENDTTFRAEVVGDFVLLTDSENDSTLTCRSLKTGGELWQADVAEFGNWLDYDGKTTVKGKVKNVYPIDEDLVVVEIARSFLVAFRISTGERLWQHNGPYTTFYNVSLYNNTFHIFSDYYYELDARTGEELRRVEFAPLLKQADIRQSFLTQPAVNEKYIAIASHYDSAILLINRADFTVAQRIDLEGCQSGIPLPNTPRFHGNRLFQLDGDGTLHVFEED
jgi:outer membrane protein assembly factor BamB